jgi:hypothetical protein
VNGAFIGRNVGIGNDFFSVGTRVSRGFRISENVRLEALAEAFNALNHRNNLTLNGVFGAGAYPSNPSSSFGQVTAVNDPRSMQLALRLHSEEERMIPFLLSAMFAVHLGPMGPDAPAREPQLAANASMVVLTFGAGKAIYFSSSQDHGKTFSAPAKVAEAGIIPLSRHRGPRGRTLRKHHRHHRGGRQETGRRPSRPRPALRWRPV